MARRTNSSNKDEAAKLASEHNYADAAEVREKNKGKNSGKNSSYRKNNFTKTANMSEVYPVNTGGGDGFDYSNINEQLITGAAAVSFETQAGNSVQLYPDYSQTNTTSLWRAKNWKDTFMNNFIAYPGVMEFDMVPTIGGAIDEKSPANRGMYTLFTNIRSRLRTLPNGVDAPAIMFYTVAASEAYKFYLTSIRAYATVQNEEMLNKFTPQVLLRAMGFDYSDLKDNLVDFRNFINIFGMRLSKIPIPNDFEFMKQNRWMYENIFKDADSVKAQYYVFRPVAFLTYSEGIVEPSDPGEPLNVLNRLKLQYVVEPTSVDATENVYPISSLKTWMEFGEQMIAWFQNSTTLGNVAAQILGAYDSGELIDVNPIAEDMIVKPTYDEQVSSIIENMTIVSVNGYVPQGEIIEAPGINQGFLIENIGVPMAGRTDIRADLNTVFPLYGRQLDSVLMNFHDESVDNKRILAAATFICLGYDTSSTFEFKPQYAEDEDYVSYMRFKSHGINVCVGSRIFSYSAQNADRINKMESTGLRSSWPVVGDPVSPMKADAQENTKLLELMCKLSAFDWHPTIYPNKITYKDFSGLMAKIAGGEPAYEDDSVIGNLIEPVCDLDNFAIVTSNVIDQIHLVVLLSAFDIPVLSPKNRQ